MKDNLLAAEYARTLHHLHRMEGTIFWSTEGLWVISGAIHDDDETRQALWHCFETKPPTRDQWKVCLQAPDQVTINQARLAKWSFDLRHLPDAKELDALLRTGTAPLRKYREVNIRQKLQKLHQRHQLLQVCHKGWQEIQTPTQDVKHLLSIEQVTLLSQSISPTSESIIQSLCSAERATGKHLLSLLQQAAPSSVTAWLLCAVSANKSIKRVALPSPWRPAWDAIQQSVGLLPLTPEKFQALWVYLTHTDNVPNSETLAWASALHSDAFARYGAIAARLAILLHPALAWDIFEQFTTPWALAPTIDLQPAQERFAQFLYVLQTLARGNNPSGRFEDIALHQSLLGREGTHHLRARQVVEQLSLWLGEHRWLLEQAGAQRHMTKEVARDLQEGWHQVIQGMNARWQLVLKQARVPISAPLCEETQEWREHHSHTIHAAITAWLGLVGKRPKAPKRRERKRDQAISIDGYTPRPYDEEVLEESAPFQAQLSEAASHYLELPDPAEVPMDRLGWTEWLWHRSWQLPPGPRATIWYEIQESQVLPYANAASYYLHQYEPILAAIAPLGVQCYTIHEDEWCLDRIKHQIPTIAACNPTEFTETFVQLCQSCPLAPNAVAQLQDILQRSLALGTFDQFHTTHESEWIPAPLATVLCEPEQALAMIAALRQIYVATESTDFDDEYSPLAWDESTHLRWKMSLVRSGKTASIATLLLSKDRLLQQWGLEAAARWTEPLVLPVLRKMLRKAEKREEIEAIALALGQQAQPEDGWPLLVILRRYPQSLPLLIAIERCATQEQKQAAFGTWQAPDIATSLLEPVWLCLSMESRCPALQEQLTVYIEAQAAMEESSRNEFSGDGVRLALWVLACDETSSPYLHRALAALSQHRPQWCSHTLREEYLHVQGAYDSCLQHQRQFLTNPTSRPDVWEDLLRWLDAYNTLAEVAAQPGRIPPLVDEMIWRYLWAAQHHKGLDTIAHMLLHKRPLLEQAEHLALALGDQMARLSEANRLRLTNSLFLSGIKNLPVFRLGVKCILDSPDPKQLFNQMNFGYGDFAWSLQHRVVLWCAMEKPSSALAKFIALLISQNEGNHNINDNLWEGINTIEAWLPPERAAIHLRALLERWHQHNREFGESDKELLLRVLCSESVDIYDARWSGWRCWSYRVQSMLIQKVATQLDREERQALAAEIRACYHPRDDHPRIRWFLEQLDVVVS